MPTEIETTTGHTAVPRSPLVARFLFVGVFLLYWITLTPFTDLSVDPSTAKPPGWTQGIMVLLTLMLMAYAAVSEHARKLVLRPRLVFLTLFFWLLLTSILSVDPAGALKRSIIAIMVTLSAGILLLLPASEEEFARLLGKCVLIVLGLCYFGVTFMPYLSVHQLNDFLEPEHAGLWRGLYVQKNEAGGVMAMFCFMGLYLARAWSRVIGLAIFAGAAFFLLKTGAKTSTALMPVILVIAFLFERFRWTRVPIVFGGVGLINFSTVGVTALPSVRDFVTSLGIDATFTARADIWNLALAAIGDNPVFGFGFDSFWGTKTLVNSDLGAFTWAVRAVDAHNAYVDAMVNMGLPGLFILIVAILYVPLRSYNIRSNRNNSNNISRLFLRVWLYGVFLACLESVFLARSGPFWFTLSAAMFGLAYQARCSIVRVRESGTVHDGAFSPKGPVAMGR
ncbi:O-antigen ligase family protein [Neorhizobium sp. NPDC001467]|uniref:O-antigen ligase family protein n=1 Tax=Neorhizobium sp. NPDC001467 TaxID=3390595 RepID=UPI003D00D59B